MTGVLVHAHLLGDQRLELGVIGVEAPLESRKIQAFEVKGYLMGLGLLRQLTDPRELACGLSGAKVKVMVESQGFEPQ